MAEMMINGDNLIRFCTEHRCGSVPIERIKSEPRIEVERVRHARWMFHEQKSGYLWKCSNCNGNFDQRFSYCPYCGSKMDGGAENDDIL